MTEILLQLLPVWGPWLVGLTTLLSCMMVPVPASMVMLAAGAFIGTGDLDLVTTGGAALAGALAGDQVGFWGGRLLRRLLPAPGSARGRLVSRAQRELEERGVLAVFLSRWLFSPLGPWVNLVAGATGFALTPFLAAGIAGEVVWVSLYTGLGITFGSNLEAATELASSTLGLLAALAAALALGRWIWRRATTHAERETASPAEDPAAFDSPLPGGAQDGA
ncbi:DedA family protein [Phaeovulum sp. W22_SRMD_FR3]|uniref:DedA family protein n=1 Tax=Phaeovulum sp. W22_SRMD_FR3 TaxID=3240274 RepID=UPI003F9B73EC